MYVNISSCSLSGWSVEKEQQDEWKSQRIWLCSFCVLSLRFPFLSKFVFELLTCNRTILVPCFLRPNFDSFYLFIFLKRTLTVQLCSGWYWRIVTFHEVTNTEKVLAFGDKVCLFCTVPEDPKIEQVVWIFVAWVHTCSNSCCVMFFTLTNSANKDSMLSLTC